jgi:HTH-type transcriptional regulator/antitoxin MqsA
MASVCPNCEVGTLSATTSTETITYEGKPLNVQMEFSVCGVCHEEIVTPEQARANDVRFADAKREASELLSSGEIRAVLKRCELSQADAARVFGGGVNAFSRYERGEVVQSKQMDLLLRVSRDLPVARDYLIGLAGIAVRWEQMPSVVVPLRKATTGNAQISRSQVQKLETVESSEPLDSGWQPLAQAQ